MMKRTYRKHEGPVRTPAQRAKDWRLEFPDRAKEMYRRVRLKRVFGITEDQYLELFNKQNGCCAVCDRHSSEFKIRLAVDHDHNTGFIRGLLCSYCNRRIINRHRKDKGADLLLAAYKYLTEEHTGWIVPPKQKRRKKRRTTKRGTQATATASQVAQS